MPDSKLVVTNMLAFDGKLCQSYIDYRRYTQNEQVVGLGRIELPTTGFESGALSI